MKRKSTVFSMMIIGVMMLTLLKTPLTTVNAAGKHPAKTPTPTGSTTTASDTTATPGTGGPGGWRTSGTQILNPSNQPFLISGVNWYGFETRDNVAHGLWTKDYKYILNEVKQYG